MVPKRCTLAILVTTIAVCLLSTGAWAQSEFTYGVTYFSNAHTAGAPDATLRIVNPGTQGSQKIGLYNGTLCANIYVYDYREEPAECCSCRVTPNGELELSVNQLTANPTFFGQQNFMHRGDIKVVSAWPNPVTNLCTASSGPLAVTNGDPTGGSGEIEYGLDAWITHIQRLTPAVGTSPGTFVETETGLTHSHAEFTSSTDLVLIEQAELADLEEDCQFVSEAGSGAGLCGTISGCTQ